MDQYLARLKGATAVAGLESTAISTGIPLGDADIEGRVTSTNDELRRIIRDYLDDDAALHKLADQLVSNAAPALSMLRDRDATRLRADKGALASLETIVRMDGSRPSFLIRHGVIDRQSSPEGTWGPVLDASNDFLTDAFTCVGRIDDPSAEQKFQGTGFLIGDDLIVTNRHVLQAVAARDGQGVWRFNAHVKIDFGHEFRGDESVRARPLKSVVFARPEPILTNKAIDHTKLDLVLIELEHSAMAPPKVLCVDTAPEWPQPTTTIFTIGYPANPGFDAFTPTLLEQLFQTTFGAKRVAPGIVITSQATLHPWTFAHDATTLGGNSGSVVLVAGRETLAAGLHYGGRRAEPRENWGHTLGCTLDSTDGASSKTLRDVLQSCGVKLIDGFAGPH